MNDEEYRKAAALLARYGEMNDHGEGRLDLPTAQIEVWGFEIDGAMMNLVGELRGACDFLFELATAARLIVQFESPIGEASALVTTPEALGLTRALDEAAHEELGPIVLAPDPTAVWRALAGPAAQPRGQA